MGKINFFILSPLIPLELHPQNPELTHHLPHFCLLKILFFHPPRYETQWLSLPALIYLTPTPSLLKIRSTVFPVYIQSTSHISHPYPQWAPKLSHTANLTRSNLPLTHPIPTKNSQYRLSCPDPIYLPLAAA